MALVNMGEMLAKARKGRYAVGNFDVFNVEMLQGVMQAADEMASPIILAYVESFAPLVDIDDFAVVAASMAKKADVPVALHLDHANNFAIIKRALKAGFTSIMIDASDKPLEENIATTQQVAAMCKEYDASIEAELGHVGGLEGQYEATDYDAAESYTNVQEAVRFVAETGVDALAVAIGTVHGVYKSAPRLNLERLHELNDAVGAPMVLHGGSGLSDKELRDCVQGGIQKLNIFTDLTFAAARQAAQDAAKEISYMEKCMGIVQAVKGVTVERMKVLGSAGQELINT